jgi:type IV secretory pathway VirJ component
MIDEVCAPAGTVEFVGKVPHAKIVTLEKVGHGFSVPRRWGAAFDHAVDGMLADVNVLDPVPHAVQRDDTFPPPEEIIAKLSALDLPLEVLWPKTVHAALVFVSGDGGWTDLDKKVSKGLASRGVAVVGWSSLRYFWQEKTPAAFTKDLARVVAALPEAVPVFAGGYSFGAETVPVVLAGAKDPTLARIRGLALLAPSAYATFEVSPLEWVRPNAAKTDYPVPGAILGSSRPVLCLAPDDDHGSGCPETAHEGYTRVAVPGGHHFGAEYDDLAARIATFVERVVASR